MPRLNVARHASRIDVLFGKCLHVFTDAASHFLVRWNIVVPVACLQVQLIRLVGRDSSEDVVHRISEAINKADLVRVLNLRYFASWRNRRREHLRWPLWHHFVRRALLILVQAQIDDRAVVIRRKDLMRVGVEAWHPVCLRFKSAVVRNTMQGRCFVWARHHGARAAS